MAVWIHFLTFGSWELLTEGWGPFVSPLPDTSVEGAVECWGGGGGVFTSLLNLFLVLFPSTGTCLDMQELSKRKGS